ncbi:MAG: hypothetical protein JWN00_6223, partial [Actinomycetia bacterium]|nr:hypothetical protein [Actinomycetes bacterium]
VEGWDNQVLGCSLTEYVGTAQLLWASAHACGGRFDPAVFDSEEGARFARHLPGETVLAVLDRHFAVDAATFKAQDLAAQARADKELRRFTYNPLRGRPALTGFGPGYLVPAPHLALAKAGLSGIYFSGHQHYGHQFPTELGHLFEQYIGSQLRLLPDACVYPEISYKIRKEKAESTDWIVVFDDLVLLVEVKSTIPIEAARLGDNAGMDDAVKKFGRAYDRQIDKTAQLITSRHPAFEHIPADRPIAGLIVTLEPFHLANATFYRERMPATRTPICVVDASEIEDLVTVTDISVSRFLQDWMDDPERSTWALHTTLQGHENQRNPILDAAWNTYPWASVNRGLRDG